jgi:hypothetical protein
MNEKRYTLVILITFAIVILYYIRHTNTLTPTTNPIATTSSMITKIREIKELQTASFIEERVIIKEKERGIPGLSNFLGLDKKVTLSDKIVLIVKGITNAGIDLSTLSETDIFVRNDSLFFQLPQYSILETIINPNEIEVYSESGDWSQNEMNQIILEAKDSIKQNAISQKIIETAKNNGEKQLSDLLKVAGYSTIVFSYK